MLCVNSYKRKIREFANTWAKQTAARSASQAPIAIRQFFQRLSVLLQRANAALIAARAPAQAPPHILGL